MRVFVLFAVSYIRSTDSTYLVYRIRTAYSTTNALSHAYSVFFASTIRFFIPIYFVSRMILRNDTSRNLEIISDYQWGFEPFISDSFSKSCMLPTTEPILRKKFEHFLLSASSCCWWTEANYRINKAETSVTGDGNSFKFACSKTAPRFFR